MLLTLKCFGHYFECNASKPIPSNLAAIQNVFLSPATKSELMKFLGSMKFYFQFIDKPQKILKPLYALFLDNVNFHRNIELKTLSQEIKTSVTKMLH